MRLEAFFEAHDIDETKKRRALLVSAVSTKTVDLLVGRCVPDKIQNLTHEAAVEKLAEYFAPKGNEIAESYRCRAGKTRKSILGKVFRNTDIEIHGLED